MHFSCHCEQNPKSWPVHDVLLLPWQRASRRQNRGLKVFSFYCLWFNVPIGWGVKWRKMKKSERGTKTFLADWEEAIHHWPFLNLAQNAGLQEFFKNHFSKLYLNTVWQILEGHCFFSTHFFEELETWRIVLDVPWSLSTENQHIGTASICGTKELGELRYLTRIRSYLGTHILSSRAADVRHATTKWVP